MPPAFWNEPLARLLESRSIYALDFQPLNQTSKHCQPGFEFNLTCQGRGSIEVEGDAYPVTSGTLLLIPEKRVHQLEVHTPGRYRRTVLCIAPPAHDHQPLTQAIRAMLQQPPFQKPRCLHLNADSARLVRSLIARIASETEQQAAWWKEMVFAQSYELLALAARLAAQPPRPEQSEKSSLAEEIASYISSNIEGDLTVQTVASHCGISREHLSRIFHQHFGITYHHYVINRRIEAARRLLADPKITSTLLEIALAAGFQSHAHFSRVFHAHTGITPMQFRTLHRLGS